MARARAQTRQQRDSERAFRERLRRDHQQRERRARWQAARLADELTLLRHQARFFCERCGAPSSGPAIDNEGSMVVPERVTWERPDNLLPCGACGRWLCRRCGRYVMRVGWRCGVLAADCDSV